MKSLNCRSKNNKGIYTTNYPFKNYGTTIIYNYIALYTDKFI